MHTNIYITLICTLTLTLFSVNQNNKIQKKKYITFFKAFVGHENIYMQREVTKVRGEQNKGIQASDQLQMETKTIRSKSRLFSNK